ncbi:BatD family protein, partial [Xylella fastidiosa]|uniref:BatD family protein n=1 Tax=Xylella fastidiosa TaxID=2371 RepID=UPI0030D21D62
MNVRQELASKKAFQTVAIPRRAGHFEIPSITWSYFNPEKVAYQTLTTNPIQIEVTPNETGAGNSN